MAIAERNAHPPVTFAAGSGMTESIARHIAETARRTRFVGVEVSPGGVWGSTLTYVLPGDAGVVVTHEADRRHDHVAKRIEGQRSTLAHVARCWNQAGPRPTSADLTIMRRSGLREVIAIALETCRTPRALDFRGDCGPGDGRVIDRISLTDGTTTFAINTSGMTFRHEEGSEIWHQRTLTTGRRLALPTTVMNSLPGRMVDDVAEGSMMAGLRLPIRKAWMSGGRLFLNFVDQPVDLDDAIAFLREPEALPLAA